MNNLVGSGFEKVDLIRRSEQRKFFQGHSRIPVSSNLFSQIPPERVGLDGEYDHSGLAKRVQLALRQELGKQVIAALHISQRGKVVVVSGQALDDWLIHQIMKVSLSIHGADFVEVFDTVAPFAQVA